MRHIAAPLIALPLLLLAACGGDEGSAPTGIPGLTTATPGPRATDVPSPVTTPRPGQPIAPPPPTPVATATVTEVEVALASLAGEDPMRIAELMEILEPWCLQDRATFGAQVAQLWRILNERDGLNVSVIAILVRVVAALPDVQRTLDCETLLTAVVIELRR
jgi:hypothetical protein